MRTSRLTLICHAMTPLQKQGHFPADESVAMDWQGAALSLAGRYKQPARLICGPEARARQTAGMFSADAQSDDMLRDGDFGHWKGQAINQLDSAALTLWLTDSTCAPHGGESVEQICLRVGKWLRSLQTQPGHVVAVTHPVVIRAALLHTLQFPLSMFHRIDVEPLSATELRFNQVWRLRLETHA